MASRTVKATVIPRQINLADLLRRVCTVVLVAAIRVYQYLVSPWIGSNCRYSPTCSEYAVIALQRHGVVRGASLTIRRLARCRPGGRSGYDPVPESKLSKHGEAKQ